MTYKEQIDYIKYQLLKNIAIDSTYDEYAKGVFINFIHTRHFKKLYDESLTKCETLTHLHDIIMLAIPILTKVELATKMDLQGIRMKLMKWVAKDLELRNEQLYYINVYLFSSVFISELIDIAKTYNDNENQEREMRMLVQYRITPKTL